MPAIHVGPSANRSLASLMAQISLRPTPLAGAAMDWHPYGASAKGGAFTTWDDMSLNGRNGTAVSGREGTHGAELWLPAAAGGVAAVQFSSTAYDLDWVNSSFGDITMVMAIDNAALTGQFIFSTIDSATTDQFLFGVDSNNWVTWSNGTGFVTLAPCRLGVSIVELSVSAAGDCRFKIDGTLVAGGTIETTGFAPITISRPSAWTAARLGAWVSSATSSPANCKIGRFALFPKVLTDAESAAVFAIVDAEHFNPLNFGATWAGGQSHLSYGGPHVADVPVSYAAAKTLTHDGTNWLTATAADGNVPPGIGQVMSSFTVSAKAATGKRQVVMTKSQGGSSITQWIPASSNYLDIESRLTSTGIEVTRAVLAIGDTDALAGMATATFEAAYLSVIDNLLADNPTLTKIVCVRLWPNTIGATTPNVNAINTAIDNAVAARAAAVSVNTDALTVHLDPAESPLSHLLPAGYELLGQMIQSA